MYALKYFDYFYELQHHQILRLHPLTLEDILHQEPREKLELFPRLGYYFVVFQALEGEQAREQFSHPKVPNLNGGGHPTGASIDGGVTGAVNVYLVVFKEGICSVCVFMEVHRFEFIS